MAKDLFSQQASLYAKYRPSYPTDLINFIISLVKTKKTAWDCATGNGQAALLLAPYFEKIAATDLSEKQISQAIPHPHIEYSVCMAEKTPFNDNSFDLITVAQAYHWFPFNLFFKEATRVGKQDSIIAVWGYGLLKASDEILNEPILRFYTDVVGKYWDAERKYVDEEYRTIPFYFTELPRKNFKTDVTWKFEDFIGYLNTWSSVQHFIRENHYNPVDEFEKELKSIWHDSTEKNFSFPIFLRSGRIEK